MTMTPTSYTDLLRALMDQHGYQVVSYADADPTQRHLIVRHDVDMSVQAARQIAECEAALGVQGHYFVLLRTEMYNLFAEANSADVRAMAAMGHRIGLHLDASLYETPQALEAGAMAECAALEGMLGLSIREISFHRPARHLLGSPDPVAGRLHAYQPRFFSDMGYCSDSRGGWHHGHPLDHPALAHGSALQLLTHPIWWASEQNPGVQQTLDRFAQQRAVLLTKELERNCQSYTAALSPLAAL